MAKIIVLSCLILAGCQSGGSFCDIASPKRYSDAVIDAMNGVEINDTLAHNEKGRKLCGWKL